MVTFENVIKKYKNKYFRRLVIEHHVNELYNKLHYNIARDRCPFKDENFMKELADMGILIELEMLHNSNFEKLYGERVKKFISKIEEEQNG